jgi:Protein of unknown function (DUF2917)
MEHSHYPFATQDWSLIRHRTLVLQAHQVRTVEALKGELWVTVDGICNDFFVKAGESINVPCRKGSVVIESTSSTAMVRVALAAQSPLVQHMEPSFAKALTVSVLRPVAYALCGFALVLRKLAVQLDPKLARA